MVDCQITYNAKDPKARLQAFRTSPTLRIATTLQALLQEVAAIKGDAVVAPDRPVLAPTVLWRPETRQS